LVVERWILTCTATFTVGAEPRDPVTVTLR
jgi:hypothetical protein